MYCCLNLRICEEILYEVKLVKKLEHSTCGVLQVTVQSSCCSQDSVFLQQFIFSIYSIFHDRKHPLVIPEASLCYCKGINRLFNRKLKVQHFNKPLTFTSTYS